MDVKLSKKPAGQIDADLIAIPVANGSELKGAVAELPAAVRKRLAERVKQARFEAKAGSTLSLQTDTGDVVLVGVGDGKAEESWRRAAGKARAAAGGIRARKVAVCLGATKAAAEHLGPVVEGFTLADYSFEKYRSKKPNKYRGPRTLVVASPAIAAGAAGRALVAQTTAVSDAVCMARDLVNEMSSVKTPSYLVSTARRIAREAGLGCTIWQGKRLEKEKMRGILAVSAGSIHGGALIKLVYKPKRKPKSRIAVVGKGITFDSGGLSLKPPKAMETMKLDMAGAAAVLGLMRALPACAPQVEVHGYIATAENMPGGRAQKPGDVITFRNGTSAEVLNTDAEGRLVLADALCVAAESKPDAIIDLATLTGACMVALGSRVAGVMGNDERLVGDLIARGRDTGERLWELPLVEDYMDDIRSTTADIKNIGGSYAGTITAALFLRCFVGERKWAHIDIAGPAFAEKPLPYAPRGGTGFGIRTLLAYLSSLG